MKQQQHTTETGHCVHVEKQREKKTHARRTHRVDRLRNEWEASNWAYVCIFVRHIFFGFSSTFSFRTHKIVYFFHLLVSKRVGCAAEFHICCSFACMLSASCISFTLIAIIWPTVWFGNVFWVFRICSTWEEDLGEWTNSSNQQGMQWRKKKCGAKNNAKFFRFAAFFILISSLYFPMCLPLCFSCKYDMRPNFYGAIQRNE